MTSVFLVRGPASAICGHSTLAIDGQLQTDLSHSRPAARTAAAAVTGQSSGSGSYDRNAAKTGRSINSAGG